MSGRAASGGALAPEPPRATRNQPESVRILRQNDSFFVVCQVFFLLCLCARFFVLLCANFFFPNLKIRQ